MLNVRSHTEKEKRKKLDRVSFQGIFVGYRSCNQARVFNLGTGKSSWHTAVKVLEDNSRKIR